MNAGGGAVKIRVIDALLRPDVLDGSQWMALPLGDIGFGLPAPDFHLPQQTLGVDPERRRMYWCDGIYHPSAARPSHFGSEAALKLHQLLGDCTLVPAKCEKQQGDQP